MCSNDSTINNSCFNKNLLQDIKNLQLTEYEAEFLKTCSPCIAFSITHVFLFLPYSCIDMINQFMPNFTLIQVLQYMTYVRYLFYSCKFYLLFLVSYRFRRETIEFLKFKNVLPTHNQHLIDSIKKLNAESENFLERDYQENKKSNEEDTSDRESSKFDIRTTSNNLNIVTSM